MITDLSYLHSMSDNDNMFIIEMVEIFREQIKEYTGKMNEMLDKSDYANLSKLAHKAKSSVAIMGMEKEVELLGTLEKKSKERLDIESYEGMIKVFIQNSEEALKELDEEIKKT